MRRKLIVAVALVATAAGAAFALWRRGEAARAFGNVSVTPTSVLLDRRGRVMEEYVGEPDWQRFHASVERALSAER